MAAKGVLDYNNGWKYDPLATDYKTDYFTDRPYRQRVVVTTSEDNSEFYNPDDPAGGWVHVSYNEKGSNRKQVLTYDGKSYENGLPDMAWKDGKVVG